jgi:hypothetical protein
MKIFKLVIVFLCFFSGFLQAQELDAKITVASQKINNTDTKRILKTLEKQLNSFLNNRKFTNEVYGKDEKISCNFLITINDENVNGVPGLFTASLLVQAARPVFNTSYSSALINYQDPSFNFKYIEFQPVEFNENRVQGTDGTVANLTATLAYYAYIILGIDHATFSPRGGDPYFQKAWNIVINAPEGGKIEGWKSLDGLRSRYWLAENLINTKYGQIHDALYFYYRTGMDKYYEDEASGRNELMNAINALYAINDNFPNLMFIQFFFATRNVELAKIFKKAPADQKQRAMDMLVKLDIAHANYYRAELK